MIKKFVSRMEINIQNRFTETDRLSVRRHQMCTWSSSDKKKMGVVQQHNE